MSTAIFIVVNTVNLICDKCGKEHKKPLKEYNRRIRLGKNKFYCCQACASSDSNPRKTDLVFRACGWCQKEFKSTTHKTYRKCCSRSCANKLSQSFANTNKISAALSAYHINNGAKSRTPKPCPICNKDFIGRTKYCSKECVRTKKREHLSEYEKYKRECQFQFGIKNYPKEFDFTLIEKYGWYKPKNNGDNLGGVSRDHIMSIKWGYENKIDPKYIRHPANCQLLRHNDNVRKGKKESITLDVLLERIRVWDSKYS